MPRQSRLVRRDRRSGLLSGWRTLPRNVWAVTLTSFLTDVSSEMIFNLLPLYLANVLGVRTGLIGFIEGVAETVASLLKVFSGWFSDRLGTRKRLAVGGYALSTVIKPLLYLADSWGAVLAVRFGDRVGKGVRTAPRDALVADSIAADQRGLAFGLHRAGDSAGAFVGVAIALGVVWVSERGALTLSRETFQRLVLISLVPAGLAVVALIALARERPPGVRGEPPRLSLHGFDAPFRRFLFLVVLFTLGNSADAFLILRAQERGLGVLGILGMLATYNAVYAMASGPAGSLSDRVGRRRLVAGGWLLYAGIYLGFALSTAAWHVWALFAFYGLYYGVVEGAAKALVADLVPTTRRGTAYGLYHAGVGLAALPASVIAGVLWQGLGAWPGLGPAAPFAYGAALALAAAILFWRLVPAVA